MTQRIPLVLVCCGSFNPITNMHLRMFEIARDFFNSSNRFNVVSGVISPVSDAYKKKDLISARHRCQMVQLALKSSNWIRLSTWEADKAEWTPTLEALKYYYKSATESFGNEAKVMLLCGGDIVETFNIPNVWKDEHIDEILSSYGLAVIKREGSNPEKHIYETNLIYKHRHNIHLINEWILNDISSTKIRRAISRKESVKYLISEHVEEYIKANNLYTTLESTR